MSPAHRADPPTNHTPYSTLRIRPATLDALAAICHVRGVPHLVAECDRLAREIRRQHPQPQENPC